jgi:hypothetical protein
MWVKVVAAATVLTFVAAAVTVPAVLLTRNGQYFIFIDLTRSADVSDNIVDISISSRDVIKSFTYSFFSLLIKSIQKKHHYCPKILFLTHLRNDTFLFCFQYPFSTLTYFSYSRRKINCAFCKFVKSIFLPFNVLTKQ